MVLSCLFVTNAQEHSPVWIADQGDGTYRNPVLHADYSDPDVCAVEGDFYMTASSFNCMPGLSILQSHDFFRQKTQYAAAGELFTARQGKWIGAKVGVFCVAPNEGNRGWADVDWFRITQ